jgi:hypothetical protein
MALANVTKAAAPPAVSKPSDVQGRRAYRFGPRNALDNCQLSLCASKADMRRTANATRNMHNKPARHQFSIAHILVIE